MDATAMPAAACIEMGPAPDRGHFSTIHLEEFQSSVGRFDQMCIDGDGGDPADGMLVHTWYVGPE